MYDPTIGRWTSQDPLAFEAGDANLYRYIANGPTNGLDPSGLCNIPRPQFQGLFEQIHDIKFKIAALRVRLKEIERELRVLQITDSVLTARQSMLNFLLDGIMVIIRRFQMNGQAVPRQYLARANALNAAKAANSNLLRAISKRLRELADENKEISREILTLRRLQERLESLLHSIKPCHAEDADTEEIDLAEEVAK